jgi:uncharacterized RDD family membrane protein YckC
MAHYSGFWERVAATLIESVVLFIPSIILAIAISPIFGLIIGNVIVQWLYFSLMESSVHQATLGKIVLGIKVTDMHGKRIGFGRATGRHFATILSTLILCIGYLMVIWTEKKQALHDIIANTLVVQK